MFSFSHLLLLLVAAIWGFAFVAQTTGMAHLGPHSFNAARFLLAAISLIPLLFIFSKGRLPHGKTFYIGGLLAGAILYCGFTFQQMGLQFTTAGNAGFITGMYIVIVPVMGIFLKHVTTIKMWAGVILAVIGLYCLSIGPDFSMGYGDFLELVGAFFWAAHVLVISWLSRKVDAVSLAISQFFVASVLAIITACLLESPSMVDFQAASLSLLYAGVASSGVAFTLQIIAQKKVDPGMTALILSTEAVFAVLGGYLLLDEVLTIKELTGCALMLSGMIVSQWPERRLAKVKDRLITDA